MNELPGTAFLRRSLDVLIDDTAIAAGVSWTSALTFQMAKEPQESLV